MRIKLYFSFIDLCSCKQIKCLFFFVFFFKYKNKEKWECKKQKLNVRHQWYMRLTRRVDDDIAMYKRLTLYRDKKIRRQSCFHLASTCNVINRIAKCGLSLQRLCGSGRLSRYRSQVQGQVPTWLWHVRSCK